MCPKNLYRTPMNAQWRWQHFKWVKWMLQTQHPYSIPCSPDNWLWRELPSDCLPCGLHHARDFHQGGGQTLKHSNQPKTFKTSTYCCFLGDSLPTQAVGDGTFLAANHLGQRPGLHLWRKHGSLGSTPCNELRNDNVNGVEILVDIKVILIFGHLKCYNDNVIDAWVCYWN